MNQNYLLKNGFVVNEGEISLSDILILDGLIAESGGPIAVTSDFQKQHNITVLDVAGNYIFPGVIDDQVHFREPGLTYKADIASESAAAVAGGVTSFMDMPNNKPPTTTIELLEQKYTIAAERSHANYSFYLGATNDNISELRKFDPANNCGIKVFLGASTGNMLVDNVAALNDIFNLPFLIAIHSEDENIIKENIEIYKQKYGEEIPFWCHPLIRSTDACFTSTKRAIERAEKNKTRLHVLHLSTAEELSLLKNDSPLSAKKITSEVCVHHLWFNDEAYQSHGSRIKWNPAIKKEHDRRALFQALLDGTIDIVATDHAPHTVEEKNQTYFNAPSGGPLIQHSFQMMLEFFHKKQLTLEKIAELMCHKPAICFNVEKRGFIRNNYFADLVIVDLNKNTTVAKENLLYKCKWSPMEGQVFHSTISNTFVNGQMVFDGHRVSENSNGMRLRFKQR